LIQTTKTLEIWTGYVKPDCLQYKIGSDLLAFICGLFGKIWYFFSYFKFEQIFPISLKIVYDWRAAQGKHLSTLTRLFRPDVCQKNGFYSKAIFSILKNNIFLLKNATVVPCF
jgi:hypothetical protein